MKIRQSVLCRSRGCARGTAWVSGRVPRRHAVLFTVGVYIAAMAYARYVTQGTSWRGATLRFAYTVYIHIYSQQALF